MMVVDLATTPLVEVAVELAYPDGFDPKSDPVWPLFEGRPPEGTS